ncbi:MAG TPA: TadE family protein [Acidimicrobiia bacterium]|jgi:Flp pilus assembly protein TadG
MFKRGRVDRRRTERGAVLVETAIIIPVFILLTFGLIEFSSAYQSSAVATSASRSGARVASAEALLPSFATDAALATGTALRTVGSDEPQEMWVYDADDTTGLPASGNFTSCTTKCIKYTWIQAQRKFDTANPTGGGWASNTQNACNSTSWDSVGVYVKLKHKFLTKLFGANITLADHAVFRLEPAPTQLCP